MADASTVASTGAVDFEAGLIRRAQHGDTAAFETLYRKNVGRVYALCLRMSADAARAEELTQDTFLRTWERIGSFRGESRFSTWLHQLAINVVLGDQRDRTRRPSEIAREREMDLIASQTASPSAGETRDLDQAIAALPDGARAIFVLHDIEGYLHEEIAGLMGVTVGTCKAQLHRARHLLREALRP